MTGSFIAFSSVCNRVVKQCVSCLLLYPLFKFGTAAETEVTKQPFWLCMLFWWARHLSFQQPKQVGAIHITVVTSWWVHNYGDSYYVYSIYTSILYICQFTHHNLHVTSAKGFVPQHEEACWGSSVFNTTSFCGGSHGRTSSTPSESLSGVICIWRAYALHCIICWSTPWACAWVKFV